MLIERVLLTCSGLVGVIALLLIAALPAHAATALSACGALSTAGDYFLSKDLTSSGTCITITVNGVSLDMKKHTITGNGTGDGISDGGNFLESMALANGTIRNFNVGVDLGNSESLVIKNLDSSNNASTGILMGECCFTLDSVTANNNGADGIDAVSGIGSYTLNKVTARNNHGDGINIGSGGDSSISNSTISGNGSVGVLNTGCCTSVVSSTVKENGSGGIEMSFGTNFVVGSTVSDNKGVGIALTGNDNLVTNTKVSKNTGDGIDLGTNENQIVNSQSNSNGGVGANVGCPGAITGFKAKGNKSGQLTTAGGTCTQLNTAQTAVSACGTLSSSGSYFLTKNLTATGNCLMLGASNIAIDMKGKRITGNGTGDGITDGGVNQDDVIIANGTITNFSIGINLSASGDAVITKVTSSKNSSDGIHIFGCCNTITSITADGNGGDGIFGGEGESNFTNVQATNNTRAGIAMGGLNTVINSTASSNHLEGVVSGAFGDQNFVIGSKAENNSEAGIDMSSACCNSAIASTATGNGADGVDLGFNGMVTESTVSRNTDDGIDFTEPFGIVSGVTAQRNGTDGVNMPCLGSTASLKAVSNASANLVETVSNGPCANVDLDAP